MLCLQLLQNCLMLISTLLLDELTPPGLVDQLTAEDHRASRR